MRQILGISSFIPSKSLYWGSLTIGVLLGTGDKKIHKVQGLHKLGMHSLTMKGKRRRYHCKASWWDPQHLMRFEGTGLGDGDPWRQHSSGQRLQLPSSSPAQPPNCICAWWDPLWQSPWNLCFKVRAGVDVVSLKTDLERGIGQEWVGCLHGPALLPFRWTSGEGQLR